MTFKELAKRLNALTKSNHQWSNREIARFMEDAKQDEPCALGRKEYQSSDGIRGGEFEHFRRVNERSPADSKPSKPKARTKQSNRRYKSSKRS